MGLVIDASAMLGVLYGELPQPRIDALMARLQQTDDVSVPAIFLLEVFNSLEMSRRRGRVDAQRLSHIANEIDALELDVHRSPTVAEAAMMRALAERHSLTVYDAAYLALALASGRELVTLDTALAAAARSAGATVFDP